MNDINLNSLSKEQKEYISKVSHVFASTNEGRELLECWKKFYFCRNICIENCPVESAKRDGENRFIRGILSNIEQFKILIKDNKNGRSSN